MPTKIESTDVIEHPRELVFQTLRDKLPELVPYLPNVEDMQVKEREANDDDATVRVLNWWKATSDIPAIAKAFVSPDMLHWLDHATWSERDWSCQWRLEINFFKEQVTCKGRNTFTALDDGRTELAIRGELTIDAKKIKGVPRLMAGTIGAAIEKFVVALITPNFTRLNQGLVRYLEDAGG